MLHHVTQEDIDKGSALDGHSCPVYRSLRRSYPNVYHVDAENVQYNCDGYTPLYDRPKKPLPYEAAAFINRFDQGLPVEPFSFELEL